MLVIFITACASGVKLNDVPVEDKSGAKSSSDLTNINPSTSQQVTQPESKVAPVTSSGNENYATGPANVGKTVYFDYDSFSVKPEFQSIIEAHAQFLKANYKDLYPEKYDLCWAFCRYLWEAHPLLPEISVDLLEQWDRQFSFWNSDNDKK